MAEKKHASSGARNIRILVKITLGRRAWPESKGAGGPVGLGTSVIGSMENYVVSYSKHRD